MPGINTFEGGGVKKPVISYYCHRIHSSGLDFKLPLVKGDYLSSSCFTPRTTTLSPNYCQLVNGYTTPGVPLREQTSQSSNKKKIFSQLNLVFFFQNIFCTFCDLFCSKPCCSVLSTFPYTVTLYNN